MTVKLDPETRLFAIVSGKGGSGKTLMGTSKNAGFS